MSAPLFVPSRQQTTFLNWVTVGRGSALVKACAGSGKTKVIELALPLIPESMSVQLFAFNSSIGKELKLRIEKLARELGRPFTKFRAGTFHSAGFSAVCRKLGLSPRAVETDGAKCMKLCRAWLGEQDMDLYASFICKLVDLAKGEGIGALVPDTEDRWYALISHHDLFLDSEEAREDVAVDLARELLKRSNEVAKQGVIDFNDQLYLVCLWRLRLWQNDWVFVDEAQDTNPVRRAIAKLALRPGGRLVAVGDERQSIFGFTGASHDAMDLIKREFSCAEFQLGVSYRCSKAAIRRAQAFVSWIEAAEGAAEGEDLTLPLKDALGKLGVHDAILCRQTAPLVGLAYELIAGGRGCTILGKDIATNLTNLIKKQKAAGIDKLVDKLEAYQEREVAKHTAKGEEQKAEAIQDRVACIMTVIKHMAEGAERTVPKLVAKLESMFSDHNGVLTLATVHKVKGKEYDNVGIYRPDLMPSKWARQEHQMIQEENLQYVAYTRTKGGLYTIIG